MFMPQSWAKLTGWKAALAAIAIMSVIGFQVWETMPHYHKVDSGTWNIPADDSMVYSFNLSEQGKMAFEVIRSTSGEYLVVILETDVLNRLKADASSTPANGQSDAETDQIEYLFHKTGSGTIAGDDIRLKAGDYKLITTNFDPSEVVVKYKIYEFRETR